MGFWNASRIFNPHTNAGDDETTPHGEVTMPSDKVREVLDAIFGRDGKSDGATGADGPAVDGSEPSDTVGETVRGGEGDGSGTGAVDAATEDANDDVAGVDGNGACDGSSDGNDADATEDETNDGQVQPAADVEDAAGASTEPDGTSEPEEGGEASTDGQTDDETDETFPDEGVMTDAQAEVLLGSVMDSQMDKGVSAEAPDVADDDIPAVTFRAGEAIEPIGFDAPFEAKHAAGEMLVPWHIRLVYDHDMPSGDDEPIVELYDGETGEFVSDYWVSTFCDNSEEREGQGLACRGAEKRFRIMYDDLVGMQGLIRPVAAVEAWYEAHKDDMPDHSV